VCQSGAASRRLGGVSRLEHAGRSITIVGFETIVGHKNEFPSAVNFFRMILITGEQVSDLFRNPFLTGKPCWVFCLSENFEIVSGLARFFRNL
jgi:hypothetical protein